VAGGGKIGGERRVLIKVERHGRFRRTGRKKGGPEEHANEWPQRRPNNEHNDWRWHYGEKEGLQIKKNATWCPAYQGKKKNPKKREKSKTRSKQGSNFPLTRRRSLWPGGKKDMSSQQGGSSEFKTLDVRRKKSHPRRPKQGD